MEFSLLLIAFLSFISVFLLFYFYFTSTFNYWKDRNVPHIKPSFPFGSLGDTILGRKSLLDMTLETYRMFKGERFYGIFHFNKPVFVLRDPFLIEKVLITDFSYFCDRVTGELKSEDVLASLLGNLRGDVWRQLRHRLSSAFSNVKLKLMSNEILVCADHLVEKIEEKISKNELLNGECLGHSFFLETTARCAFGIEYEGNGLTEFCKRVKKTFFNIKILYIIVVWYMYLPKFASYLHYFPPVAEFVKYFRDLTSAAIKVRKISGSKRNDFLQIMIDLKEEESKESDASSLSGMEKRNDLVIATGGTKTMSSQLNMKKPCLLSDTFITSQMFLFMGYGLDLSAAGLTFLVYDLATHPEVQLKVQEEVDAVVEKYGGLTFEAVNQLTYLDMVLQECARLKPGPGFPFVTRVCQSVYKVPDSDLVLEKGMMVLVPSFAVHQDPSNYPDPELFDPERFRNNNFKPSTTFLPFGVGPRMCLALRLVVLEFKIAVAKMMQRFTVKLPPDAEEPSWPLFSPQFIPKMRHAPLFLFEERYPTKNNTDYD